MTQYLNYLPFKPLNEAKDALINHGIFLKELILMHYFIQLEGLKGEFRDNSNFS